jgi:hypothetical protein
VDFILMSRYARKQLADPSAEAEPELTSAMAY